MNTSRLSYTFLAHLRVYPGAAAWRFVLLQFDMFQEIRTHLKHEEQGWGRLKATAEIGSTRWETAIWFDTKHATYMLPLKASVRKKEGIADGDEVEVKIYL
ncbi:MAG: DUF1905 domain-containing protein [Flavobacteriales bacterium]